MRVNPIIFALCLLFTLTTYAQDPKNATHKNHNGIPFIVTTPDDYSNDQVYPTIIFLHGGDRSNTKHHPAKYASKAGLNFPFIVIAPSCTSGCSWSKVDLEGMLQLSSEEFSIDLNRIYLTGYSMGGAGTWTNLKKIAPLLAAAAPLAPAGGSTSDLCKAKDLPIRVYHGTADHGYENSKNMVKKLKECGSQTAELMPLEGAGHGIWPAIFSDESFYSWLLDHSKS